MIQYFCVVSSNLLHNFLVKLKNCGANNIAETQLDPYWQWDFNVTQTSFGSIKIQIL